MKSALPCFALIVAAAPAMAQDVPSAVTAQGGAFGGLSSLLGGGLPKIGSTSVGNAAGLLGYCVKNNLLGGANANTVLGQLSNKAGVATSPGYAAGQNGTVQAGSTALSLDSLKGQLKNQVCQMVLKRASSFLAGGAARSGG